MRRPQELRARLHLVQLDLGQTPCHVGVNMALDAFATADHDTQVPSWQCAAADHEVKIGGIAGAAVQRQHGASSPVTATCVATPVVPTQFSGSSDQCARR